MSVRAYAFFTFENSKQANSSQSLYLIAFLESRLGSSVFTFAVQSLRECHKEYLDPMFVADGFPHIE